MAPVDYVEQAGQAKIGARAVNAAIPLLEKAANATVSIHCQVPPAHSSVAIGLGTERTGTGTIVSNDGLILTVNYMLMGAQSVAVTLATGEQLPAQVVARDFTTSLGVLKIDGRDHPHIEPASSEACELGQEIFTISSMGDEKRCADTGIVTYLGPFDAAWEFVLERCVCVTASSLNIGLNGGPICNAKGQLIAVSYLNFADLLRPILGIPAECFISGRDELVRHGHRVSTPRRLCLGVLSFTLREHVVIAGVFPGSPSDKAGLRQGDLVLSADDAEIHERKALYDAINKHRPGESVRLRILRNNEVHSLEVPAIIVDDYLG
ncbi:MAG TPA: S1C family serine protease [Candidatus Binataceae bacterium]|jgi:S1-C subfamily serine protease|nr:S1C family serine protease [Candidatus Binataceae bacterium]